MNVKLFCGVLGMLWMFSPSSVVVGRAAESPIDRWASAVGGREKVSRIAAMYREATIEVAGYTGSIKTWHTSDGKYRKDEQIGPMKTIEIFDGNNATLQQDSAPLRVMAGADLQRARSTAFANSNAMFFALFPERRHGTVSTDGDQTVVLKPEGGIDWRITLDPRTSLPATMVHQEGERTITVTFLSYVEVDGIKFEQAIDRANGNPFFHAVIHFTKTVINPTIDSSLFVASATGAPAGR